MKLPLIIQEGRFLGSASIPSCVPGGFEVTVMMFWFVCIYGSALSSSDELMPFKRGCESPSRKPKLNESHQ